MLVVDDEPTVRMLITDILHDLGYTAIEASDSAAGLKVRHSDVRIDLLVTDVGRPGGMNGRQMADAARVFRPNFKVLFITGCAKDALLGHGKLSLGPRTLAPVLRSRTSVSKPPCARTPSRGAMALNPSGSKPADALFSATAYDGASERAP